MHLQFGGSDCMSVAGDSPLAEIDDETIKRDLRAARPG